MNSDYYGFVLFWTAFIRGVSMGKVQCYSCMSLSYQNDWTVLSAFYFKPHSFTDRCNDPFAGQHSVGTVACPSLCVTLREADYTAGVFTGNKYIRGCLDRIVKNGFNESAINTHRFNRYDLCSIVDRSLLMKPGKDGHLMQQLVEMCACFRDRCNRAAQFQPLLLLLLFSFHIHTLPI